VRVGAKQVITREVEAAARNAHPRTCFDAAMQGLPPRFPLRPKVFPSGLLSMKFVF